MTAVALVLRSGGPYVVDDVHRLADSIEQWLPGAKVVCLSDVPVAPVARMALEYRWPGWWSKMELYRPDILDDLLYFDLDTIARGPLEDLARLGELAMLRDFYRPKGLGSGLMFLPAADRSEIWTAWHKRASQLMLRHRIGGDQALLEEYWLRRAARIQDRLPGQVTSYKANSLEEKQAARVVCFHGRPKPRDVDWQIC